MKPSRTIVTILRTLALLFVVASAQANDLRIEEYSFQIKKNGTVFSDSEVAGSEYTQLGYMTANDVITADIDVAISWGCVFSQFGLFCLNPEDFYVQIKVVSKPEYCRNGICLTSSFRTYNLGSNLVDGGTEIRDRGGIYPNTTAVKHITKTISSAGLNEWLAARYSEGHYFSLQVVVDPAYWSSNPFVYHANGRIEETDLNGESNNIDYLASSDFLPFTGSLAFGPTPASLTSEGDTVRELSSCGYSSGDSGSMMNLQLSAATGEWVPSPSGNWADQSLSLNNFCVQFAAVTGGLELEALTTAVVNPPIEQQIAGFDVVVPIRLIPGTGVRIDGLNILLPELLSSHDENPAEGGPLPAGSSTLNANATVSDPTDINSFTSSGGSVYLHSEGLPFSVYADSFVFDNTGLTGTFSSAHYVHDRLYSSRDLRQLDARGPETNDSRFSVPASIQGDTSFSITPSGLQLPGVDFDAPANTRFHFPRIIANGVQSFNVGIQDGFLIDKQTLSSLDGYTFSMTTDCASCDSGGQDIPYSLRMVSGNESIGWDGSVMSKVWDVSNPAWGPEMPDGSRAFERNDDSSQNLAVMMIPGGIVQGTSAISTGQVSEYLLGVWEASQRNFVDWVPGSHHLLGSKESRRGNHFMAGLTVGPEFYSTGPLNQPAQGLGFLLTNLGRSTRVAFGGVLNPDYHSVLSNEGTKYIVRPGGLTGAFNSDLPPQPLVYGFDLQLTRFGFRLVSNVLDEYSWIDGKTHVPGRGDFDIVFDSLALECSGDIGGGLVVREQCAGDGLEALDTNGNGTAGDNCNERLLTWQTNIGLQTISFVPENLSLGICEAQNRDLLVGNTVELHALQKPLGLVAKWTPGGDPFEAQISGDTDQTLDKPTAPGTSGFPIAMDKGVVLDWPGSQTVEGWFAIDGQVGIPFWNSLPLTTHLANRNLSTPEQTIAVKRDSLAAPDQDKSNPDLLTDLGNNTVWDNTATYEWGDTGFGFGLDVFYQSGRYAADESPQFLGRMASTSLIVLDANAGIDFITPKKTKVSFGASADFARLRALNIDLHIDLTDPGSVSSIDSFVCSFLSSPCVNPVDSFVGSVNGNLDFINDMVNSNLDAVLEQGLRDALPDSIFTGLANALGEVQSIPELLASVVEDEMNDKLEQLVTPLSAEFDQAMLDVYNKLPGLYVQAVAGSPDVPALQDMVETLGNAENSLASVKTTFVGLKQDVLDAIGKTAGIAGDLTDMTTAVNTEIAAMRVAIMAATNIDSCTINTFNGSVLMQTVGNVSNQLTQLNSSLDDLRTGNELLNMGLVFAQVSGVDTSALNSAQEAANVLIEEVSLQIETATASVEGVCNDVSGSLSTVMADVDARLLEIENTMVLLSARMNMLLQSMVNANGPLKMVIEDVERGEQYLDAIAAFISTQKDYAEQAQDSFAEFGPTDFLVLGETNIRAVFTTLVYEITDNQIIWYYPANSPASTIPQEHSFVLELVDLVRAPVDASIQYTADIVNLALRDSVSELPHPEAGDLEDMVVDLIMNSSPVHEIQTNVNNAVTGVVSEVNSVVLGVLDQGNVMIQDLIQQIEDQANAALNDATAGLTGSLPVSAASMDGYALIAGNELERLHLNAEWTTSGDTDEGSSTYGASLDVTSWNANNKGQACGVGDASGLMDAVIATKNLPISIGSSETTIRELYLGFTLDNLAPNGFFGGISLDGEIDFETFTMYDVAFAAGVGQFENYLGASAGASFEDISLEVAFLVGKTCNGDVLASLDAQAAEFITMPGGIFNGAYARGSASIPIWSNGCALTVGVSADAGAWILAGPPLTVGGIVGGGAYGKALCIASLRGQVTAFGEKSGDQYSFGGEGFGVAGVGFDCDPGTWTSVSRSRGDDWCGTGDASFGVKYQDEWIVQGLNTSAIH